MAYFDCIVGGSGKGNTLVVTCADDLAGATITCTNGTKTYTKTCPSTSPYEVTFYGLEAGTWTVSATVSGDTYTTTVVITDYEAELGGFSWRTWVNLSKNYTSSDFTDLDELLDTELAVRELMSIHACVDYLAGIAATSADVEKIIENDYCAKWINNRDYALDTLYANTIIADYMDTADKYFYGEWVITDATTTPKTWGPKGNVPVMTSNTAPYGEASSKDYHSDSQVTYYAYHAFSNDIYPFVGTSVNTWLQYKFANPVCVKEFLIASSSNERTAYVIVQGSNDGFVSDTHDLTSEILTTTTPTKHKIENDNYYLYYRIYCNRKASTSNMGIQTIQFYGRELSVSVPKMDTNTTPYGVASGAVYSQTAPYLAFDGNNSTHVRSAHLGTDNYIQYTFKDPVMVCKYLILSNDSSDRLPRLINIEGSSDGVTFNELVNLNSVIPTLNVPLVGDITLTSVKALRVYFNRKASDSSYDSSISTLQFYGFDYSEKEFEEGTNKKWLYDHGLELETLDKAKGSTTSSLPQIQSIGEIKMMADGTDGYSNYSAVGKQLDITPYSLLRVKIGREMAFVHTQDLSFTIAAATSFPPSNGTYTDSMWIGYSGASGSNVNNPNTLGYDVSAISGVNWVICGSFYWKGRMATLKELWLE